MSKGRAVWQRPDVLNESDVQMRAVKSRKRGRKERNIDLERVKEARGREGD